MSIQQQTWADLEALRRRKPLIHNITNFVVMNGTANVILAAGASPVMAHAAEEVEEMAAVAGAVVLNIGTLWPGLVDACVKAGKRANVCGVPVVFDPVGAGATTLRTEAVKRILGEVRVSILRCNAAEAFAAAGRPAAIRGVDSLADEADLGGAAREIARQLGVTVAITGRTDVITDGTAAWQCRNGHPLLQAVTGTGCAATAMVGCFAAVQPDPVLAAAEALGYYGLCGELAAPGAAGPGSFETALRDRLYSITRQELLAGLRLEPR
ncbi:MAG: hydroxyethylthiazole kinase [Lentisphaeria bacterium]